MPKYSPVKTRMVRIPALCALFVVMFSSCETKKAVVPDTAPGSGRTEPGAPKTEQVKSLLEMVLVNGGTFRMGSPRRSFTGEGIVWPPHNVTVKSFYIGKYEVTRGQFLEVTELDLGTILKNPDNPGKEDGWMTLPAENVNWYDTLVFCNKLSIKEKLKPVYSINNSVNPDDWGETPTKRSSAWDAVVMDIDADGYRLPTEAEWEYAARGGTESKNYKYAGSDNPDLVAWYSGMNNRPPIGAIHEVGKKQPNELGLYDMSGNVLEWCWDWYGEYPADDQNNPLGPSRGLFGRVIRGGGWFYRLSYCQVVSRHRNEPYFVGNTLGFRVVRNK